MKIMVPVTVSPPEEVSPGITSADGGNGNGEIGGGGVAMIRTATLLRISTDGPTARVTPRASDAAEALMAAKFIAAVTTARWSSVREEGVAEPPPAAAADDDDVGRMTTTRRRVSMRARLACARLRKPETLVYPSSYTVRLHHSA